jgi:hypothetical protein
MEHKINNIEDINWDDVFPAEDILIWQGKKWSFSDFVGNFPGAGGPVIETVDTPKEYFCVHSMQKLEFFKFDSSFLGDDDAEDISFLLPSEWSEEERIEWFEQYKIDRLAQEEVRREMLNTK